MPLNNPTLVVGTKTGSYAGNGADGRQIATGFECSKVVIHEGTFKAWASLIPSSSVQLLGAAVLASVTAQDYIHATDGFVVEDTVTGMNTGGKTYYYWAISV